MLCIGESRWRCPAAAAPIDDADRVTFWYRRGLRRIIRWIDLIVVKAQPDEAKADCPTGGGTAKALVARSIRQVGERNAEPFGLIMQSSPSRLPFAEDKILSVNISRFVRSRVPVPVPGAGRAASRRRRAAGRVLLI